MIQGKTVRAHRISYQLFIGPISKGMMVCHSCDNPLCVNPKHLFLGTQKDNIQDLMKKNRNFHKNKTHCKRGHDILDENNIYRGNNPSWRFCRKCRTIRNREFENNRRIV